jgi:hypothetical protein
MNFGFGLLCTGIRYACISAEENIIWNCKNRKIPKVKIYAMRMFNLYVNILRLLRGSVLTVDTNGPSLFSSTALSRPSSGVTRDVVFYWKMDLSAYPKATTN